MTDSSAAAPSPADYRVVIEPRRGLVWPNLRGVWAYRDLFYFLVRRDVALVYKQTALGVAWAVLRPLTLAAIYYAVFGLVLKLPSDGVPFAAFVITGLMLWLFFATAVARTTASTVASVNLISKVYFPRLTIPLAAVVPALIDFAIGFLVLEGILLLGFGITPRPEMLAVPLVLLVMLMLATGAGLILSALSVRFRDVEIVISFILQVLLFASAVLYPLSILPEGAQSLYAINPLVGVMETFRSAMLPVGGLDLLLLVPSAVIGAVLLVVGLFYFARVEQTMADVI